MGFIGAVGSGFNNYANFEGRALRSEYWYWVLFLVIVSVVTTVVDAIIGSPGIVGFIVGLALLLPGLAVAVRRLHDIDKSGWNLLWSLIPLIGSIYLIFLMGRPGTPEANEYGPALA